MIEAYSINLTTTSNEYLPFNNKQLYKDLSVTISSDGTKFYFNRAGVYQVDISAIGQTTTEGTFGFQLTNDTTPITRTSSVVDTGATTDVEVGISTLIDIKSTVDRSVASVGVQYIGGAGTISRVNAVIRKVG